MIYRCEDCGHDHEGLPDLGMDYPDPYLAVPVAERPGRTTYTPDRCTVEDEDGIHYFVRGILLIPIHDHDEDFGLGVWVSQSRTNFERYTANEPMETTFGWLVNRIEHYPETTFLLKARLHFRGGDERPRVELEPSEHPLAKEQHGGISLMRAWRIIHHYTLN